MTTAVSSKKNLLAWRAKHQAEQPGCKCLDCQSTAQNVNGVEFLVRPDGTVGWAEDWVVLFDLAHKERETAEASEAQLARMAGEYERRFIGDAGKQHTCGDTDCA